MKITQENTLAAPCGICCAQCIVHMAKGNEKIKETLIARGMKKESVPCPGCRMIKGNCPVISGTCETYTCADQRDIEFCFQCPDFPCDRLCPASDRADTLPHNLKIFNLCFIKEKGLARWLEEAPKIQKKYFHGKMVIGKGPAIEK